MGDFQNITLDSLIEKYRDISLIPYGEFLMTDEWKFKRQVILNRDNRMCYKCGIMPERKLWQNNHNYFHISEKSQKPIYGHIIEFFSQKFLSSDKNNWLEVHHNYYVLSQDKIWKLPWLYEGTSLITLCSWCHQKLHETVGQVHVFMQTKTGELVKFDDLTPCSKCDGLGWLPQYDYFLNGICFNCNGDKYEELIKPVL